MHISPLYVPCVIIVAESMLPQSCQTTNYTSDPQFTVPINKTPQPIQGLLLKYLNLGKLIHKETYWMALHGAVNNSSLGYDARYKEDLDIRS